MFYLKVRNELKERYIKSYTKLKTPKIKKVYGTTENKVQYVKN